MMVQGGSGGKVAAEITRLEAELADLRRRWPAHSVKPSMIRQLEELEERLALLKAVEAAPADEGKE